MALTYGQRPRIVVEEGPLASFLGKLPSTIFSFMQLNQQLKFKAEEAAKDRQFRESQLYLKDLMDTKQLLQKSILDSKKIAETKGLSFEVAFSKLESSSPESVTPGAEKSVNSYMGRLQQEIDSLENMDSSYSDQLRLAGLGQKIAVELDRNYNSIIDPKELNVYNENNPELLEQLGFPQLPQAVVEGAKYELGKPAVRKKQKENKNLMRALNVRDMQWDFDKTKPGYQEDPSVSADILGERRQARVAYDTGQDTKFWKHFIESYKTIPSEEVGKVELDNADLEFRTQMDIYQDQITRTSEKFRASLPWGAGQDFKKGGFISNVDTHKENLEKTLETWFAKTTGSNTDRWIRNKYDDYLSKATGTEAQKRETAVGKMLVDPAIKKVMAKDNLIWKSFGWDGSKPEEEAAVQIFRTTIDMYNLSSKWSGKAGGGISKILEGLGHTKRNGVEEDPWITKNLKRE